MKILVFSHRLEIGGTQVNAIEIASGLRDFHGHDVVLFATPGPMVRFAKEKGLRFIPAPDSYLHPSLARMRALLGVVRREKPDLLHVWDWWQVIDAFYAVHLVKRVPMVVSDMMMDLTRILPKYVPTTFGIPALVEQARRSGRRHVDLLTPPVDVAINAPNAVDPRPFIERFELRDDQINIVTVSRLATHLKGESLVRSIEAVRHLGREFPLRLLIVGEGAARAELEQLARQANAELGRAAVVLTGALLDPRAAYAAASIVIGMGGSSLRGLAFAKPLIVVGEGGFAEIFDATTAEMFYHRGMYGRGRGDADSERLTQCVRKLVDGSTALPELGQFGRRFVVERFSLQTTCERFAGFCDFAVTNRPSLPLAGLDGLRTAAIYLRERRFLTPSRDREPRDEVADALT